MPPNPQLHPAHMNLYPTMNNALEAIQYIESKLPITSANEMFPLLMMFHNTLLKELDADSCRIINLNLHRTTPEPHTS